jgi:hypothetical protein
MENIHFVGYRYKDSELINQMLRIKTAYEGAGMDVPKEVTEALNYKNCKASPIDISGAVRHWNSDKGEFYKINILELPDDVEFIKVEVKEVAKKH